MEHVNKGSKQSGNFTTYAPLDFFKKMLSAFKRKKENYEKPINTCKLYSTLKKEKKKRRQGIDRSTVISEILQFQIVN